MHQKLVFNYLRIIFYTLLLHIFVDNKFRGKQFTEKYIATVQI